MSSSSSWVQVGSANSVLRSSMGDTAAVAIECVSTSLALTAARPASLADQSPPVCSSYLSSHHQTHFEPLFSITSPTTNADVDVDFFANYSLSDVEPSVCVYPQAPRVCEAAV